MQLAVTAPGGAADAKLEVADAVFGCAFNRGLVHQVVVNYLARARQGTAAQKTRAEVSGGGRKPWRQKGTGRARAGTIRSPLWRGGGVIFAARPRQYGGKVNRKVYRAALRSILSELLRQERMMVIKELVVEQPRTRDMVAKLKEFGLERALVVVEEPPMPLVLAARNLPGVEVVAGSHLDPVSLLHHERVLITVPALQKLEERLQ